MNHEEQALEAFVSEYKRSARLRRPVERKAKPKSKPKTRSVSELSEAELEARRAAKRRTYEAHKHEYNERRRYLRSLERASTSESIKRFKDRRDYIAPKIEKRAAQILLYLHQGMSAEQAWQEVNRPKGLPLQWKERPPQLEARPSYFNPEARTEVIHWNPKRGPWYKELYEDRHLIKAIA